MSAVSGAWETRTMKPRSEADPKAPAADSGRVVVAAYAGDARAVAADSQKVSRFMDT